MKKIIIGCLVVLGIIFALVVAAGGFLYFKYGKSMMEANKMPEIFQTPTVFTGEGFIQKEILIENNRFGRVTDIIVGGLPGQIEADIGVVGSKGAVFLNSSLEVQSSVTFGDQMSHVDTVDVESDGELEFMNRGAWGNDAAIYNNDGQQRWTYGGGMNGINDMSAGNFDKDTQKEFVVGFNGGGGVHLIDENGKQLWKEKDGNVWHVEAVDIDNDGISEIIHSNAAGKITIRNSEGKIIKQSRPQPYFSDFSMLAPLHREIVLAEDDRIWLFDLDGNVIKDFDAPHAGSLGSPFGTMIQFDIDGPKHYAFSVSYQNWKKCNVYIYDPEGNLQYHEILDERCEAISTMPNPANGEVLLVGGHSRILKYRK